MQNLPVHECLPALQAALTANVAVVLQAPPGAGKTTVVPPALLAADWLGNQRILMLEPRRLAARAAAARMADGFGEAIGGTVGYRIRFESKVSARTRIEVVTEGMLTRRLQTDQALDGVGLVIFDEFHERHLQTDLALALTRDCQRLLRPDLKILIMSATLDGAGIAQFLEAPLIKSEGRLFPVDVRYVARESDAPLAARVAASVRQALTEQAGDVLAFLPGGGEIRRAQALLADSTNDIDIRPLYGDLPWEQQDRALRPGDRRKVVLATPIAETSLTIEGVRSVVDSGYARVPQFDPASGLTRLATVRVARASADQRAGRAGRLGPGVCYRLWTESTHRGLLAQPLPEIKTADLAGLALELALWGANDVGALTWLDPPPPAALAQARDLLTELGAINGDGRITSLGRAMAALPLHPRLAHLVRAAEEFAAAGIACDIAALLSERDIYSNNARKTVDLSERLEALAAFRARGRAGAQAYDADPGACARIEQAARQWRGLVRTSAPSSSTTVDIGALLALAYPDRVAAQREPNGTRYLLASGRGARLPNYEARLRSPYLVVAHVDAGESEGVIHLAAPVDANALRHALKDRIVTEDVVRWDDASASVLARREERLGKLLLRTEAAARVSSDKLIDAMLAGIARLGIAALPWTEDARGWQARVLSLRHWLPDQDWPDVSDAALAATLAEWLAPYLDGVTRRDHLTRLQLLDILKTRLDWDQQKRLDEGAPTHVTVPSGSHIRLAYTPGESAVLAVKLQEMFGLADTPRVAWGRVPVTLHLLSPARRPIQVTQDLRGFWERTYAEVKKELKGRYPKHPWPDDPWSAPPTRRVSRPKRGP
ncbi:MAG: ATP-dependent helicase HrpB [Gammaproteobacteria bacterium]|nr:ATP-dependent helicase HrpB [Gammaproteobacteria bacterium]